MVIIQGCHVHCRNVCSYLYQITRGCHKRRKDVCCHITGSHIWPWLSHKLDTVHAHFAVPVGVLCSIATRKRSWQKSDSGITLPSIYGATCEVGHSSKSVICHSWLHILYGIGRILFIFTNTWLVFGSMPILYLVHFLAFYVTVLNIFWPACVGYKEKR
jgi:hypothetical protein